MDAPHERPEARVGRTVSHDEPEMERRPFGSTAREVPVVGQGTWYERIVNRERTIATLRRGIDLGMTHIDTAEMYTGAEEVVGEAIHGRRREIFLVSKVLPSNASRTGTVESCERSLRHLRTDYLDCYLLHWRSGRALEETFEAFEQLLREGKILSWGVSNFDVSDLEEAWAFAGENSLVCNQVLYHLQERAIEHGVLPWCQARGLAVVAYSPFGHGEFPKPRTRGWRVLRAIAEAHDATVRQVALRFLVRRPPLFAIPKAERPEHVEENVGAGSLRLTESEIARIEEVFPLGPPPRELPLL